MKNTLIQKHAKSFYWASFFLSKKMFKKCSWLYDFCRTLDNIADCNLSIEEKKRNFNTYKEDFLNQNFTNPEIKKIWALIKKNNLSIEIINDLFKGIESDISDQVYLNSSKELELYAYQVGGTVGLMMAKLLHVTNTKAFDGAKNLGIAMQLTNISRDVVEDKNNNRFYIEHNLNAIKNTLLVAETFYQNSYDSIKHIPVQYRLSICVARRVYRKIGRKILSYKTIEEYNKSGKTYVTASEKLFETILATCDFLYFLIWKNLYYSFKKTKPIKKKCA